MRYIVMYQLNGKGKDGNYKALGGGTGQTQSLPPSEFRVSGKKGKHDRPPYLGVVWNQMDSSVDSLLVVCLDNNDWCGDKVARSVIHV